MREVQFLSVSRYTSCITARALTQERGTQMELSNETIRGILERHSDWQWCSQYGERGYGSANTSLVVLGDYWCRCAKFGTDERGRNELHSLDQHHPRIWKQLETQGVELEWYDEWTIDYENDKAYRVSGDSYSWQCAITYTDDGEILTPDDDLDLWLEHVANNASRCLPSVVWSSADLIAAGFAPYNGTFHNGWHAGMTDDPATITQEIREALGDTVSIVFLLDESSQFYVGFSAWTRADEDAEQEDDEDYELEDAPTCTLCKGSHETPNSWSDECERHNPLLGEVRRAEVWGGAE